MITNYSKSTTSNEFNGSDKFFAETTWNNTYNTNASVGLQIYKQKVGFVNSARTFFLIFIFFFLAESYHCLSDHAV